MDTVDYTDRSTEYWVFGGNTILDSRGKIAKKHSCPIFFFQHLFRKNNDGPGSMLQVAYILTKK